jgi:Domain of unknown function (DUF4430)
VFRRFFVLAVLAALLVVPSALAARVHVRVEGKGQTIFGATQPTLSVQANALDALESASVAGEFYYHVTQASFGPYVDQIGRYAAAGNSGWVFKVNGVSPPVGAKDVTVRDGDRILWYWATFGATGGPATLVLRRTRANCYRVLSQDDRGALRAASGALLRVDARRVRTRAGRGCVGRHFGLVRATKPGTVRSNALR